MKTIFIIGKIGSGKTQLCSVFSDYNAFIINCDALGHDVLQDKEIVTKLIKHFGDTILKKNGPFGENEISRSNLAKIVFANEDYIMVLNSIMIPAIKEELLEQISLTKKGMLFDFCVCEIPVFDQCLDIANLANEIIYIKSSKTDCINRCVKRGMSYDDAIARWDLQASEELFEQYATLIFENNGSLNNIENFVNDYVLRNS
ncbi:MAG: dephospho-CoA kinase [Coriobacteriales bacterium]|nr:dephospho-CoA kinase [Coriobacteriales bacterium]